MEQCTALGSLCRNSEIAARGPDGSNLLGKSMEEMQVDGLLSAFEGAVPGAWWGHLCVPSLLWVHGQPDKPLLTAKGFWNEKGDSPLKAVINPGHPA